MAIDQDLLDIFDSTSIDGKHTFVDVDTIRDDTGHTYRLAGVDAAETSKLLRDSEGNPKFKQGTAGGSMNDKIQKLATEHGFTNVVIEDKNGAAFGRGTFRLTNDKGEDFSEMALRTGIFDANPASSAQQLQSLEVAQVFGEQFAKEGDEEFKALASDLMNKMVDEGYDTLNFKRAATNEAEYASDTNAFSSNVQYRSNDRNIMNEANNPWSDSWSTGWTSVGESAYGILDLLGDTTNSEMLSEIGETGAARARARMFEKGQTITHWKDVDSFGSGVDFLANNLMMSLPQMSVTAAAMLASPVTGGASLVAPVSLYTGGIYNEQKEKNAAAAIAGGTVMAALDMMGLKMITKGVGNTPKEFFAQGVSKLMNSNGLSKEAATELLSEMTRKQVAGLAKDAAGLAKSQLTAKKIGMDVAKRAAAGGVAEGSTEVLQELIGYTAAHQDGTFDWEEATDRMINAGLAAAGLGAGFGTSSTMIDKGRWAQVAWEESAVQDKTKSAAGRMREHEIQLANGVEEDIPNMEQITAEARDKGANLGSAANAIDFQDGKERYKDVATDGLDALAKLHVADHEKDTISQKLVRMAGKVPGMFWRSISRDAIRDDDMQKSRALRKLGAMFDASLQKIYPGESFEMFKHTLKSKYVNMVPMADKFYKTLGFSDNYSGRAAAGRSIYTTIAKATDKNGRFDPSLIPDDTPNKQMVVMLVNDLRKAGDAMWQDQQALNPELGYIQDYLLKYKAFDKKAIHDNQAAFIKALTELPDANISLEEASALVDAILNREEVNDLNEAFTVVRGGPQPEAHKKRSLGLSERAEFQGFMDQDILGNAVNAAQSAARYQGHEKFIGKNGGNIAALLLEAKKEGVSDARIAEIAYKMKDLVDAESGNYKRPTTKEGEQLLKVQKNFTVFTTITSLTLATLSSLPEYAMAHKGLSWDQIFGKDKNSLKSLGEDLAKKLDKIMGDEAEAEYAKTKVQGGYGEQMAQLAGMYDQEVGAASKMGISEATVHQQQLMKAYFKLTFLTQYTDKTREIRASFAADYIFNRLSVLLALPEGYKETNETYMMKEELRNLGMDTSPTEMQTWVNLLEATNNPDPALAEEALTMLDNRMRGPVTQFINDGIVMPQSTNRPKIYQDPRFALFTQFQGFMATFTANHLPKMWDEYVRRGSPAMKYHAFALMTTMIMLGFVSQWLKDQLKYGRSTPYLTPEELVRRGVTSSGLLGTYDRLISTAFPIYETRSKNEIDWLMNEATGQSPAISKAGMMAGIGRDVILGDLLKAGKGGAKLFALPTTGPAALGDFVDTQAQHSLNWLEQNLYNSNWDYKGGQK